MPGPASAFLRRRWVESAGHGRASTGGPTRSGGEEGRRQCRPAVALQTLAYRRPAACCACPSTLPPPPLNHHLSRAAPAALPLVPRLILFCREALDVCVAPRLLPPTPATRARAAPREALLISAGRRTSPPRVPRSRLPGCNTRSLQACSAAPPARHSLCAPAPRIRWTGRQVSRGRPYCIARRESARNRHPASQNTLLITSSIRSTTQFFKKVRTRR